MDVSDTFYFPVRGAGEMGEASEEVARGSVLIENRRAGGLSEEGAWGRGGNVCGEGEGG